MIKKRLIFLVLVAVLSCFSILIIPKVYGATVNTSTIRFNSTQDANTNVLAGSRAQVKFTNTVNSSVHGPYNLNSTGGYSLGGLGNGTAYNLEFYWDGTKVYEAPTTTSNTAGTVNDVGPYTVNVFSFQITLKDLNSDTFTADSIDVTAVNSSVITYSSVTGFTISQAANGSWSVAVKYRTSYFGTVKTQAYALAANVNSDLSCSRLEVDVGSSGTDFYIPTATTTLSSCAYASDKLTAIFTDGAGTTSTVKIYTGTKDKPRKLFIDSGQYDEGYLWQYDSIAKIVTVTWLHKSPATLVADWAQPTGGGPENPQTKSNNSWLIWLLILAIAAFFVLVRSGKRK